MIIPPISTFLQWQGRATSIIIFPFFYSHLYDTILAQICIPLRGTCIRTEYLNTLVISNRNLNLAAPRI
jgi:hypothetical protein